MTKTKEPTQLDASSPTLIDSAWRAFFDVADDSRQELHKQLAALLAFASGALAGGTRLAGLVNDRANDLARAALRASDRAGRDLVANTRETARDAALRASETARTLIGPRAKAA